MLPVRVGKEAARIYDEITGRETNPQSRENYPRTKGN